LSGYQVWAGDCADADPDGTPDLYPGATRGTPLASSPGGTTAGTASLGAVDVTVRQVVTLLPLTTGPVRNTDVTVSGIHGSATGCTAGETLSAAARTDGNGKVRLALPYGTWTVRVTTSSKEAPPPPPWRSTRRPSRARRCW
jgi:hypothetical protein